MKVALSTVLATLVAAFAALPAAAANYGPVTLSVPITVNNLPGAVLPVTCVMTPPKCPRLRNDIDLHVQSDVVWNAVFFKRHVLLVPHRFSQRSSGRCRSVAVYARRWADHAEIA